MERHKYVSSRWPMQITGICIFSFIFSGHLAPVDGLCWMLWRVLSGRPSTWSRLTAGRALLTFGFKKWVCLRLLSTVYFSREDKRTATTGVSVECSLQSEAELTSETQLRANVHEQILNVYWHWLENISDSAFKLEWVMQGGNLCPLLTKHNVLNEDGEQGN